MTKEKLIRYGKDYLHDLETACCSISDIHKEFVRESIKALETVDEFEKAQLITGGRLNGRAYAYKCGLEDGKRKALEQSTSDDCVSRRAVLEMIEQIQNAGGFIGYNTYSEVFDRVDNMPPVTPTHGTCKDCKYNKKARTIPTMCDIGHRFFMREPSTFYCADFERRE